VGKNRKQLVLLDVMEGRISFIPKGSYQIQILSTKIIGGSIELTARIITSGVPTEEYNETNPA
jgi:hypothetical protein